MSFLFTLRNFFGRIGHNTRGRKHRPARPQLFRPGLESLEDRLAPATDITISTGPTAGGAFVGGVFTLTGNPATANVNNVEIQNLLNAATSVTIDTASAAANPGDITVTASIAKTGGGTADLTLRASNTITITGGSDLTSASNALNVTLNSDRDANGDGAIALGAGSVVDSNGGSIVLGGGVNPLTTAAQGTASQPIGIDLNGAQLASGAGTISLRGRGHDLAGSANHTGIQLVGGSLVQSTGGNITLHGTGGAGTSDNIGVAFSGAGTLVTSADGDVQITGIGGAGTGSGNRGVDIFAGGRVTSTGTTAADAATITISGTGGAGTLANDGVLVTDATSQVTSVAGAIQISGTVAGPVTADNNLGVNINNGAPVSSTGTGANAASITLQGTGGNGSNNNLGVAVQNGGLVTSVDGAIQLTGTGGNGTSNSNIGVGVRLGGQVSSTGAAAGAAPITFNGTGGIGTSFNSGVSVENAGSLVTSIVGAIQLTGQGGDGSTDQNFGVAVRNGGVVNSTGTGAGAATITVNGTGGPGTDSNHGVDIELVNATVTSVVGAISITGQAAGSGASNIGVLVGDSGVVSSTGTGASAATITVAGTGGNGTTQNYGVDVENTGALVTSVEGAIQITGTGGVASADSNAGAAVRNGGAVRSTGTGTTAAPITIVGTGGTGTDINFGVEVGSTGSTVTSVDGDISITGQGGAGSASLNIGIVVSIGGVISSTGTAAGAANITLNGTGGLGTFNNHGLDVEGSGSRVTSVVGAIQITGQGGAGSNVSNVGATVRDGGVVSSTGTGANAATITVNGTGGVGTAGNFGVEVTGAGALITSVAGNVQVNGTGAVPAGNRVVNGNFGTGDFTGSALSGDTADAFVTPFGSGFAAALTTSPGAPNFGLLTQNLQTTVGRTYLVSFDVTGDGATPNSLVASLGATTLNSLTNIGAGTSTFTSSFTATLASNLLSFQFQDDSGLLFLTNISVIVQGSGPGANNDGVRVSSSGAIESTGAAAVTVTGTGSTVAGASGRGVRLLSPGTVRAPATGNVTINGTGAGGNAHIEWDNLSITKTGGTYTFNDTVLGTSTLTANAGAYNVTFNDGGTINGTVTLNDTGTVTLGSAGDAFTFGSLAGTVPATAIALNATQLTVGNSSSTSFAGTINGEGALVKQGTGTLSLSNPNSSFTGNLTINQGSIAATGGHNDTLPTSALGNPSVARNITVNAGASLQLSANDVLGNFSASPAATLVVNGGTVTSTATFFNILGPLQLNGGTLSAPSGGANPGFQAYSLFGTVTVGGAAASTISTAGPNNGIHLNTSTTFDVANVTGNALADLIISAPLINRTAGHGGAPGALVKAGVGTATLSGASTYTGTTTVNAGTLLVTGSIMSNTTVNSGGTLGGTGTIAGTILANAGGTVAPGTSPGILNVGSTTFSTGSTFSAEINGATVGTQYDQLNVTGTVALGGATLGVTLGAFTPANSAQFVLINNDGADAVTDTFADLPEGAALIIGGTRFVITYVGGTGNDVVLIAQESPSVTLSLQNSPLAENGGIATVTATLSATSVENVTVTLDFTGTATDTSDYVRSDTTIFIPAGSLTGSITLIGVNDLLDEPDETVIVDITGVTNGTENGAQQVTATITDDDNPPTVSIGDVTVTEGDSGTVAATFTISLSAASGQTVTVNAAAANNNATAPSDYVAVPATPVTFTPGQTSQTFTVLVNGDTLDEANETFFVNLSSPSNATILDGQGQGTITDDDNPPTLSINDVTVTEGNSGTVAATFTVSLSAPSGQTVTVNAATVNNNATTPDDYAAVAATPVTFAPGQTSQTFTVLVNGDTLDEINETFFVNLSSPSNATLADGQGIGTITDDDLPPTISINDVTVTEGNVPGSITAVFTISLSAPSGQTVTFTAATADASATAPGDYTSLTQPLNIPAGMTSTTFAVQITSDTTLEPAATETFLVNLSAPTNATLADGQGVGTITEDDTATVRITANDPSAKEGGTDNGQFTVTMTSPSATATTVNYTIAGTATNGGDYATLSGSATIPAGQTSATIDVTVLSDLLIEGNETVVLTLSGVSGDSNISLDPNAANRTATVTIRDLEANLSVTMVDTPDPVAAGSNLTFTITLTNSGPDAAQNVTLTDTLPGGTTFVSFAVPTGFTATTPAVGAGGTVTATATTLASGASVTFSLVVRVNPDAANNSTIANTVSVTSGVLDPVRGNNSATTSTAVITRADLSVSMTSSPSAVNEGSPFSYNIVVTNLGPSTAQNVTLTDVLPALLTFNSASSSQGSVNQNAGTVNAPLGTLAPGGQATVTIQVTPKDNGGVSNTATASTTTTDPNTANNSRTVSATINNVAPQLSPLAGPTSGVVGQPLTFTATWTDPGINDTFTGQWNFGNVMRGQPGAPFVAVMSPTMATHTFTAPGTYTITFTVRDDDGGAHVANKVVTISAAQPQLAADVRPGGSAALLTEAELTPIVGAALARLASSGLDGEQVALLSSVQFTVADLNSQGRLGQASLGTPYVVLDDDGAGHGWFIDLTPDDDSEYSGAMAPTQLQALAGEASGRYDLLTVVMHELMHVLGHESLPDAQSGNDLMAETLTPDTRRLPQPPASSVIPAFSAVVATPSPVPTQAPEERATQPEHVQPLLPGAQRVGAGRRLRIRGKGRQHKRP